MKKDGKWFSDDIWCGCKKIKLDDDYGLSDEVKEKIHEIVERFIDRMEDRGYSDEKIKDTIDEIIDRLEELKQKQKYRNIVKYMIDLLEEVKLHYDDDFSIFDDIFWDY